MFQHERYGRMNHYPKLYHPQKEDDTIEEAVQKFVPPVHPRVKGKFVTLPDSKLRIKYRRNRWKFKRKHAC